jgi:PAS domain S-box-containing protein
MLLNARRIYREGKGTDMILLAIDDITERKKMEEAVQVSETRYRRLFETAQDGILILDADSGEIFDVNPFLIEMLGYSHEAFLGKRLWEIGAFRDMEASKAAFLELQGKGYIRYEDLPLETRDRGQIDVEFVSNVYLVNHKKVIQCNIRDITQRRRIEEERRRLTDDLQDALAKIKRLRGLLPICASCKKIRDDKGYWNQLETYIQDHSEAEFSHGFCPECMKKLYGVFLDEDTDSKKQ